MAGDSGVIARGKLASSIGGKQIFAVAVTPGQVPSVPVAHKLCGKEPQLQSWDQLPPLLSGSACL
jgi:hypothetical protein